MSAESAPWPKCPWPYAIPNCQPRQLTINLISKPSFQGQVWQKGVWQRRKCFKGEAATSLGSIQLWHAAWRVVPLPDSPQLKEIERGPTRVNLPPLEEGPFHEGEENNLCEGQNRQRAIPESKLLHRGAKDDLSSIFTGRPFLRSPDLYLALKLQSLGGERGRVHTWCWNPGALIPSEVGWLWKAEGEAKATRTLWRPNRKLEGGTVNKRSPISSGGELPPLFLRLIFKNFLKVAFETLFLKIDSQEVAKNKHNKYLLYCSSQRCLKNCSTVSKPCGGHWYT